jgi:hypothetical protein
MTSVEELNAQIEEIRQRPDYIKLLKMSRGPQEAAIFADFELKIRTINLRKEELIKREPMRAAQTARRGGGLVARTTGNSQSIVMTPTKPVPDPEPPRQALFTGSKPRSMHLKAPQSLKPLPGAANGEAPEQMIAVPAPALPPPADTSMNVAAGATPMSVAKSYTPAPKPTASQGPTYIQPVVSTPKAKAGGRVAPSSASRSVAAPKGLQQLQVNVLPVETPAKEMRKASMEEVEDDGVDLSDIGLSADPTFSDDNIIQDLDPIGNVSDSESDEERPVTPPPMPAPASAKKRAAKTAARKK